MAEGMLLPTTSAQVSGHKFLVRRIEHGLVMGDVRMIHDPLGRRRRAVVFGAVACIMLIIGSVVFAIFKPAQDPSDAPLIRAESGALFVRLEDAVHPVANISSARLILGEAVEPVNASDTIIAEFPRGVPVGLADAPGIFSPQDTPVQQWFLCQEENSGEIHVLAENTEQQTGQLGERQAVLGASKSDNGELHWHVVSADGRRQLPAAESPEGRIIRRHLQIDEDTPRFFLSTELLNAIPERNPIALPQSLPEIVDAGARSWVRAEGELREISALQRAMLIDAGAAHSVDNTALLGVHKEGDHRFHLPEHAPNFLDLNNQVLCADGKGQIFSSEQLKPGVALSGDAVASTFISDAPGAVGVDSGFGYYVVADTGLMHAVSDGETLNVLGMNEIAQVPWTVLKVLPYGSDLSREKALVSAY